MIVTTKIKVELDPFMMLLSEGGPIHPLDHFDLSTVINRKLAQIISSRLVLPEDVRQLESLMMLPTSKTYWTLQWKFVGQKVGMFEPDENIRKPSQVRDALPSEVVTLLRALADKKLEIP